MRRFLFEDLLGTSYVEWHRDWPEAEQRAAVTGWELLGVFSHTQEVTPEEFWKIIGNIEEATGEEVRVADD